MIKLLADEHFPLDSTRFLQKTGYDIKAVILEMPAASDPEIIALATEEGRIIVTYDSDYGELIFKYHARPPKGVIYLRNVDEDERSPGEIVHAILSMEGFDTTNRLTVVSGNVWRQRAY